LVNNAGIAIGGPLEILPIEELRRQFDVNVFGPVMVTQAFLPLLRRHHGRLVFIGSVSDRLAVPFLAPYSSSKFALRAIADALRVELAESGVFVSIIEPGSVKTPIWRKGREEQHRLAQLVDPRVAAIYARDIEELIHMTEREERIGMPVKRVTEAIVHALVARRPKTHYLIGSRLASAIAHLPAALRDKLVLVASRRPN
jgi:NAD(P)-dependent dehydrogenase (short-subunit alcohol dehydrogenase family)